MTYCLGIVNQFGIVICADSRTNAGVDYASAYRKLFDFVREGERAIFLAVSGNLSITQGVLNLIQRDLKSEGPNSIHSLSTMGDVAEYVGNLVRKIQERDRPWLEKDRIDFQCNILLGGQIHGEEPQLFLIYPQGNFIQATREMPFLQIGETKYGKPLLDRMITYTTPLDAAAKCAILSMDSTMKSNVSVGPPIHLVMYPSDSFCVKHTLELRLGDPYLAKIRQQWEASVRQAFEAMPNIDWQTQGAIGEASVLID